MAMCSACIWDSSCISSTAGSKASVNWATFRCDAYDRKLAYLFEHAAIHGTTLHCSVIDEEVRSAVE